MNIIQKIIDNKDIIVGIEVDDVFYDVDSVLVDDVEVYDMLAPNDDIIWADGHYFTVEEIKNAKDVKLYKLEEI